jgi:hypothetical protein
VEQVRQEHPGRPRADDGNLHPAIAGRRHLTLPRPVPVREGAARGGQALQQR